jgi:heptosyltransferase-2
MWIGDFVRCHSVVKILRNRWPDRPVDILTNSNNAPLLDYMPGVRKGIVCDLPRGRLPISQYVSLANRLRAEDYATALVMPRTWKAALAPFLAGIAQRVGFVGEGRFGLINDLRWGERRFERMVDCCGALALPKGAPIPQEWPLPELIIPEPEIVDWRARNGVSDAPPIVAIAPGAIGPGKRWSTANFAELARRLNALGAAVWVLGGPGEAGYAREITSAAGPAVRDLTGPDLRNAIIALEAADVAVTNDSGLMHVAAALGTSTVALFGPTDPKLWAPLNPLAAILEPTHCSGSEIRRRRVDDIPPEQVLDALKAVLAKR